MRQFPVDDSVKVEGGALESEVATWWDAMSKPRRAAVLGTVLDGGIYQDMWQHWPEPVPADLVPWKCRWVGLHPFWQACLHCYFDRYRRQRGASAPSASSRNPLAKPS